MSKSKKWIVRAGLLGSALIFHNYQLNKIARKTDQLTAKAVDELNAAHPGLNADCYFIDVGGIILHTLIAGPEDGPLAVLLHGFPEHWVSWRKQVPALAQAGYRVVVPDQRGYNRSSKPWGIRPYRLDALTQDIANLITKLGRETAVIIAHDWGGGVGWQFAADYPQMTDKLIIMNAPHPQAMWREFRKGWEQRLKSWYMLFFQLPLLPELVFTLNPYQTAQQSFQQMTTQPGAFNDDEVEMMAVAMSQPRAMTSMINWYRALRYPAANQEAHISAPTLLIWGEQDFALSRALTEDLEPWVPNIQRHYIAQSNHWVQNEAPAEVNAAMLAFLQS
ncbi:MAG: alpha/beta hydrolase [Ardenticatenaceae bacterium]|nr:alpha/beta hydrolase [Ardenticatenaceae bacterium]MCB8947352.1 alpha/beta hydrolase [Ardenticatenaceae bacterium]